MRRIILSGIICLLSFNLSFADGNIPPTKVDIDSLRSLFNKYTSFEVLYMIDLSEIDCKECYSNKDLWPYFMEWIDKETVYNRWIKNRSIRCRDENIQRLEVKDWLKNHNQKEKIDSVIKDSVLFNSYLDSVDEDRMGKKYFSSIEWIRQDVRHFHARLKLPEAYTIMRKYWEEDENYSMDGYYFKIMLEMQDPKAIKIYNAYVDSLIETNNVYALKRVVDRSDNYCSYSIDLKIRLLKIRADLNVNDGTLNYPFIFKVLFPGWQIVKNVLLFIPLYKSDNPFMKRMVRILFENDDCLDIPYDKLVKYAEEIREHADEIEKIYMPFKQELIEKEKYWKDNMPYVQE